MRYLACFLLLISSLVYSQNIEIYGGPSFVQGTSFKQQDAFYVEYEINIGVSLGIVREFNVGEREFKAGLSYENYSSNFRSGFLSSGGSYLYEGKYQNQSLSIDLYPISIEKKWIELSFGLKTSVRFNSKMDGSQRVNSVFNQAVFVDLDRTEGRKILLGLQMLAAFPLSIAEKWDILPQLHFYHGVTRDYDFAYNEYKRWLSPQVSIRKKL